MAEGKPTQIPPSALILWSSFCREEVGDNLAVMHHEAIGPQVVDVVRGFRKDCRPLLRGENYSKELEQKLGSLAYVTGLGFSHAARG
jgi:hypothetical protein